MVTHRKPIIQLTEASKFFGYVQTLKRANISVQQGEIVAMLGLSTATAGEMKLLGGNPWDIRNRKKTESCCRIQEFLARLR